MPKLNDYHPRLSRKEFLYLVGAGLGAMILPAQLAKAIGRTAGWPSLNLEETPPNARKMLNLAPKTWIGPDGYLNTTRLDGNPGRIAQARTAWNLERSKIGDRLYTTVPWGIVLHWYGDREDYDKTISGYLRGFDDPREVAGEFIRTSAHFLVGNAPPRQDFGEAGDIIGIVQTQAPDLDGTPFVASHLRSLDHLAHRNKEQYFVRALYQLSYAEPAVHSVLQDFFDGPRFDPNMRTIAIEICGTDFENPEHFPSEQQIANVVSLVWALMSRYNIPASNLLGHNEIQLNKPDPGKKFMALIRYLVGVKAALENNPQMKHLVFGQYLGEDGDGVLAQQRYFKFIRDYLVMVGYPRQVFEWEATSGFWFFHDTLNGVSGTRTIQRLGMPVAGTIEQPGFQFLNPENHEGTDLNQSLSSTLDALYGPNKTFLVADGTCIFLGESPGCHGGKTAIFRHRQADGAEILTVYGHLNEVGNLCAGCDYPMGFPVGSLSGTGCQQDDYLHFAVAYGATWDTDLSKKPSIPLNAGTTWIRNRYFDPIEYLKPMLL